LSFASGAAIPSSIITTILLHYFDRRPTTFALAIFAIIAWVLFIAFNQTHQPYGLIIFARGLMGVSIGSFSALTPLCMVEIAPMKAIAFFGTLNQLGIAIGFVLCYSLSSTQSWLVMAAIGTVWPFVLACLIKIVPESKYAKPSRDPIDSIMSLLKFDQVKKIGRWCLLMVFQQTTGVNVFLLKLRQLLDREADIDRFRDGNSGPAVGASLGAVAQVIACLICAALMPHINQRALWSASLAGTSVTNLVFAVIQSQNNEHDWLTFTVILCFLLSFGLGAGPIPWFGVPSADTDHLPLRLRAVAMTAISCLNWTLVTIVLVIPIPDHNAEFRQHIVFAVASAFGALWGFFFVPNPWTGPSDKTKDVLTIIQSRTAEQDNQKARSI
jgi:MFS family permease